MHNLLIIKANRPEKAHEEYVHQLQIEGVVMPAGAQICVEPIHQSDPDTISRWLCYLVFARDLAA